MLVAYCPCTWLEHRKLADQGLYNSFGWNNFFLGNAAILIEAKVAMATVACLWPLRQLTKNKEWYMFH